MALVNPVVLSMLEEARRVAKRILLVSDMYLGSRRLGELLRSIGVGPELYDEILVSSDQGVSKANGAMFRMILNRKRLRIPQESCTSGTTAFLTLIFLLDGIRAVHYPAITDADGTIFLYEQIHSPGLLPEFTALRRVMWQQCSGRTDAQRFWHRFGCCVLGPFLDDFGRWVVETCADAGIDRVIAVMRDGHTLGPLVQRAARAFNLDISVLPGWFSRRSVFFAGESDLSVESISSWFGIDTITIEDLFSRIESGFIPPDIAPWASCPCSIVSTIAQKTARKVRNLVTSHLLSPAFKSKLQDFVNRERAMVVDYLRSLAGDSSKIALVDIGYTGTIGRALHKALNKSEEGPSIVHLLAMGHVELCKLLLIGMDVRCYAGGFGEHWGIIQKLLRSIAFIDESLFSNHGSTKGYLRHPDGLVMPVCDAATISREELDCKTWCHEGIADWQAARNHQEALLSSFKEKSGSVRQQRKCCAYCCVTWNFHLWKKPVASANSPMTMGSVESPEKRSCSDDARDLLAKAWDELLPRFHRSIFSPLRRILAPGCGMPGKSPLSSL